jgi:hypothetical protein
VGAHDHGWTSPTMCDHPYNEPGSRKPCVSIGSSQVPQSYPGKREVRMKSRNIDHGRLTSLRVHNTQSSTWLTKLWLASLGLQWCIHMKNVGYLLER